MRDVTGTIHGREHADLEPALAALNALPGCEAAAEEVPEWFRGWSVRYVFTDVKTADESWEVVRRAAAAVSKSRHR